MAATNPKQTQDRTKDLRDRQFRLERYFTVDMGQEFFGGLLRTGDELDNIQRNARQHEGGQLKTITIEGGKWTYGDGEKIELPRDTLIYVAYPPEKLNPNTLLADGFITAITDYAKEKKVDLLELTGQLKEAGFGGKGEKASEMSQMYRAPLYNLQSEVLKTPNARLTPTIRVAEKSEMAPLGTVFAGAKVTFSQTWVAPEVAAEFTKQNKFKGMKAEMSDKGLVISAENPRGLNELKSMLPNMKSVVEQIETNLQQRQP